MTVTAGCLENMSKKLSSNGFTLLEVLLSVAIISLLAGLSLSVYRVLIKKNDLDIAATTVAASLRRAQILSQAVDRDEAGSVLWGVKVQSESIILFNGPSYAARDTALDEIFDVPATVSIGGSTEIVFAKFTGFPQAAGAINLSTEGDSRSVSINEKGTITY